MTGVSVTGAGVTGAEVAGAVVSGEGVAGSGVAGAGVPGARVTGEGVTGAGVVGARDTGEGVIGSGVTGAGVFGEGLTGAGVTGAGVFGKSPRVIFSSLNPTPQRPPPSLIAATLKEVENVCMSQTLTLATVKGTINGELSIPAGREGAGHVFPSVRAVNLVAITEVPAVAETVASNRIGSWKEPLEHN